MANLELILPSWLVDEHGITLATWGLVVATLVLWLDSWKKGKEQRDRWTNEDKQRQEDRDELRARWKREDLAHKAEIAPKYSFDIELDELGPYFWIANMGTTAFLVKTVFLNRTKFGTGQKVPFPNGWNEPVPVGAKRILRIERGIFPAFPDSDANAVWECEVGCSIIDATGQQSSASMKQFTIYVHKTGKLFKVAAADY
jgi:hypothetical protein